MANNITEQVAYPSTSKRIKLNYLKHLARELGLPTVASCGDLEVMMYGDMEYDVENCKW